MKKKLPHCHHLLKTLSNALRIKILDSLKKGEMSVSEIVDATGEEQSKISHALKALRKCRIVFVRRDGKRRIYSMNKDTITPMFKIIDKHVEKYCDDCKRR